MPRMADKGPLASPAARGVSHGPMRLLGTPQKPKNARGTSRRLLGYLRPHAGWFALVVALSVAATVFNTLAPRVLGDATNVVYEGVSQMATGVEGASVDLHAIHLILTELALLYIGYALCFYLQRFVMVRVTQRVAFDLRRDLEHKFNLLPLSYYDAHATGDVLSRVTNDVDSIASTLQEVLTQLTAAVVTLVGVLVMMLLISPAMTLIALVTLPLSILATRGIARRSQPLFKSRQDALGALNGQIEEAYSGHAVVTAFAQEQAAQQRFDRVNEEYYRYGWRSMFITGIIRPALTFIGNLGYVGVCVAGTALAVQGVVAPGDIQAFLQYMRRFSSPITRIASMANTIQSTLAAAERAFEFLDEPEMDEDGEGLPERDSGSPGDAGVRADVASPVRGEVSFEHVDFGYVPGVPVIRDLSFTVGAGQTVAIVGPTGAGKSTLMNLLMRFYDLGGGRITIDGVDIATVPRRHLRRHVAMVLQDPWLFSGSIRENIAYGREGATDAEVVQAARVAHADHFIRTLPAGYDTRVSEEGGNLSAGQRQLVTIARAVLSSAELLVLDEATSSIDSRTERLVQQAMAEIMEGRTSFVIAHRLSTIRDADRILVVRDGAVVEQGTHARLLAEGGFYAELYRSQFAVTGR